MLARLVTIDREGLELRMSSVNVKIIESKVAVLMVLDNERQLGVG
jgi:hypothetical protein